MKPLTVEQERTSLQFSSAEFYLQFCPTIPPNGADGAFREIGVVGNRSTPCACKPEMEGFGRRHGRWMEGIEEFKTLRSTREVTSATALERVLPEE